jgi:NitT/TauT family transport system permease protein
MNTTVAAPSSPETMTVTITPRSSPSLWSRLTASRAGVWLGRLVIAAVVFGVWQYFGSRTTRMNFFISTPIAVFHTMIEMLGTAVFWTDAYVSLKEAILGFVISAVVGSACGFALAQSRFANRVLDPFISALNSLPRIALASVFILYFGLGEASKVALAVSLAFFIFLINIYQGASAVNEEWAIVMRTMGANRLQFIRKVTLQSTVPWAIAASRLGMSQAIAAVIIGEMLSAQQGLGSELLTASSTFDTSRQYAILVCLLIFAMILNEGLGYAERRTSSWSSRSH